MNLLTVTTNELRPLPIAGVAAICLRAAMRLRPLIKVECDESLALANKVLLGSEACTALYDPVEYLYQNAARAAAEYRTTKREDIGRVAMAGAVIHSAVDCIADLDHDPQAALTNAMLALRSVGKLNDEDLSREVMKDLSQLISSLGKEAEPTDPLKELGPLWSGYLPAWCRDR